MIKKIIYDNADNVYDGITSPVQVSYFLPNLILGMAASFILSAIVQK